jgi:hypothetical protein
MITEEAKIVQVAAPSADMFNTNPDTAPLNCKNYSHVLFLINRGAGATGTATLVAKAATGADKAGAQAVPFRYRAVSGDTVGALTAGSTSGITTPAGANGVTAIEVDVRDLPDGKPWLFLSMTEGVDSPVVGGVTAFLYGGRYGFSDSAVLS